MFVEWMSEWTQLNISSNHLVLLPQIEWAESVCMWYPVTHYLAPRNGVIYNKAVATLSYSSSYKQAQGSNLSKLRFWSVGIDLSRLSYNFKKRTGFLYTLFFYTMKFYAEHALCKHIHSLTKDINFENYSSSKKKNQVPIFLMFSTEKFLKAEYP